MALGDSPNDAQMLGAADIAVVIPPKKGCTLMLEASRVLYASEPGPIGWNAAMNTLLDELEGDQDG